tara:strand:+ start:1137 stop:1637 length:501 start_codon:yes stop_codon:yes gene_type:complete
MLNFDTLFLDRDGVINIKLKGRYVRNIQEFVFMPEAESAIVNLSKIFKRILIITNQQGIGKGIMSSNDLNSLHEEMLKKIREKGGVIDKIYYCPHLAAKLCSCRKPNTGMISQAISEFPDLVTQNSYLVGDSDSDIQAGKKMGLKTVKVDNNFTLAKWSKEFLSVI